METKEQTVLKLITLRERDMEIIYKLNDFLGDPSASTAIRFALREWERTQDKQNNGKETQS